MTLLERLLTGGGLLHSGGQTSGYPGMSPSARVRAALAAVFRASTGAGTTTCACAGTISTTPVTAFVRVRFPSPEGAFPSILCLAHFRSSCGPDLFGPQHIWVIVVE